jgi:hypothetical protein
MSDPSMPPSGKADDTTQKMVLSKTPKDLQTAIITATPAECVKGGVVVDGDGKAMDQEVTYLTSGFAETGIGCGDGGSRTLFAKSNNTWQKVGSTQFLYSCTSLKKYKVPVGFLQAVAPDPTESIKCNPDDPNATEPVEYNY